jgi:hypothetical protein
MGRVRGTWRKRSRTAWTTSWGACRRSPRQRSGIFSTTASSIPGFGRCTGRIRLVGRALTVDSPPRDNGTLRRRSVRPGPARCARDQPRRPWAARRRRRSLGACREAAGDRGRRARRPGDRPGGDRGAPVPGVCAGDLGPDIVQCSLSLGFAILVESGLSFLGRGVPPPAATSGRMVSESRKDMEQVPLLLVWPSLAIALATAPLKQQGA